MTISASSALRTVNLAVEEQRGRPFDVIVVKSSRTQSSLHNSKASRKFFASNANVALPSTSIANTDPEKTVIGTHFPSVSDKRPRHERFASLHICSRSHFREVCR